MMTRGLALIAAAALLASCSGTRQETAAATPPAGAETAATAQPAGAPQAVVTLKNGKTITGTIVASSATDMTLTGTDGIEMKIPMAQVKSVTYGEAKAAPAPRQPSGVTASAPGASPTPSSGPSSGPSSAPPAPPAAPAVTYDLPAGSEVSVRTLETIDSGTAADGQTFNVQFTQAAKDAAGATVIPAGAAGRIVIVSASQGGRFKGQSDLVLDLQSVVLGGQRYAIDAADITEQGRQGVGTNKRTAKFAGGGAAIGALIGAIAGGGKGAAIGAGTGAGAGLLTQVLTKGNSIKVPAESVLTFRLDKPLRVTVQQ